MLVVLVELVVVVLVVLVVLVGAALVVALVDWRVVEVIAVDGAPESDDAEQATDVIARPTHAARSTISLRTGTRRA